MLAIVLVVGVRREEVLDGPSFPAYTHPHVAGRRDGGGRCMVHGLG